MIRERKSGTWTAGLSDEEKAVLLAIAQDTLRWCVGGRREPFGFESYDITPKLKESFAVFVTLRSGGGLRGCIGSLWPEDSLYVSVHENTVSAALRDTRFSRVERFELPSINIDVSLLSPIRPIRSVDDFKPGEHGIILEKGAYRAVFLPEVASEHGWTREETLSHLSLKAGLPEDAWRAGAGFRVFESVVLSEENSRS